MDLNRRLLSLLAAFLITLTGAGAYSAADDPIVLRVRVDDVFAYSGQQNVSVPVWLDNYQDTVAGFSVWLQLDRPDIALFQVDWVTVHDTSYWRCDSLEGPDCVDSTEVAHPDSSDFFYVWIHDVERGNIDTTGTLVTEWEYISATSISGADTDLHVVGLADMPGGEITPGIPPQESTLPLFRLLADVENLDDTTTLRTVNIYIIQPDFAAPNGSLIGWMIQEIVDTSYWRCLQWSGDTCLAWQQVSGPPYDSISTEIDTIILPDTSVIEIIHGSITVVDGICGDIDGSGGGNVADLTYLVNYLFRGGPPPPDIWTADCNGNGSVDVADLTCFVCYLFLGCPPPACDVWF